MGANVKSFRITEFKGLNKTDDPHNIDDAEMVELNNMELTKNRTIQARMGHKKIGDTTGAGNIRCIYKVDWSDVDNRLYYVGINDLVKMDESDGSITTIDEWLYGYRHVYLKRYKDKLLVLNPSKELFWFDEDEELNPVRYPQFKVGDGWITQLSNYAGGDLDPDQHYQYNVSFQLGVDARNGETAGALKGGGPVGFDFGWYAYRITTTTNKTIVASDLHYTGSLYGFDLGYIRLFRRKCDGGGNEETSWELLDAAPIEKYYTGSEFQYRLAATSNTGIITSITGSTYNSTDDSAKILLDFIDDGDVIPDAGYQPLGPESIDYPKAMHLARLHNRIFLANIYGTDNPMDVKKVCYSYRGLAPSAKESEIPDFLYEHPMLIFPYNNYFYCDAEDVEDEIAAISTYQNNVIIFTERCTFVWREGMADPIKLSNDIGCIAPSSIREFEGKLIWLGANGFNQYNGSEVRNIGYDKIKPYVDSINRNYVINTTSAIYDRKYFVSFPYSSTWNDLVLVYDFDLREWSSRTYKAASGVEARALYLYTYNDGYKETLYGGFGIAGEENILSKLEYGYDDDGTDIDCTAKMKYFDFGAPDWEKTYRNFYIDVENYSPGLVIKVYTDNLNEPKDTITFTGMPGGFIVNSETDGVVNRDYIKNFSNDIFNFSHNRNIHGPRMQYEINLTSKGSPAKIHSIIIDWLQKRKVKAKYGG